MGLRPNELTAKTSVDGSEEIVIDKAGWTSAFKITLTKIYNWIRTGLATTSYVDSEISNHNHDSDYADKALEGKVKATSQGTAGYLSDTVKFGDYVENGGDSEEVIITGKTISDTDNKNHTTDKKILRAVNLPRVTPSGNTPPNINNPTNFAKGVKVTVTSGGAYLIYGIELYLKSMSEFTLVEHTVKIPALYNDDTKLMSIPQLSQLLQQYTMSLTPTQLGASGDLETEMKIYKPDGTQLTNLTSAQFSLVAIGGYVTNATFSGSGSSVTATLTLNPLAPAGHFSEEYGNAIVLWQDSDGHSADRNIRVIWDVQNTYGELKSIVVTDWPSNNDLNYQGDYLVFKPGSGIRLYHFDSANNRYCYEDYAGLNGACLLSKS